MTELLPREIISELDRHIIGQDKAKRALAIALRNRWRRQKIDSDLRDEIVPRNILMIGPTGSGKTELSRRIAKLAGSPFLKVEATKFTEVGYVGRDVEQIIRDLVEVGINITRLAKREDVEAKAYDKAEEAVLDALVGADATPATRASFRKKLREDQLGDKEIHIEVKEQSSNNMPMFDLPSMPGAQVGMLDLSDIFGKMTGSKKKVTKTTTVADAYDMLMADAADDLLDNDQIVADAIKLVENQGIVFIDEIDKICRASDRNGGDVSREGVQRDLLPLIEGTSVTTKHGSIDTSHILFIASGAFHVAKPSDLLPELQGRLPIRVELNPLTRDDFLRILTETEFNLVRQSVLLLGTEEVTLNFTDDGIAALADTAININQTVEDIGARRLQTVVERVLEEISFSAPERTGETITIDKAYVDDKLAEIREKADLSRFIL